MLISGTLAAKEIIAMYYVLLIGQATIRLPLNIKHSVEIYPANPNFSSIPVQQALILKKTEQALQMKYK